MNKKKIFNDPVYGFISIPNDLIFDLIEHPYFQRLRRIKQLGLTHLVYPGALHTRFHHALGCMHLMNEAIEVLRSKGHKITDDEATGALIAVLLHDIGHGPFSHSLEHSIVEGINHEKLSELFMDDLNVQFKGKLTTAIAIFKDEYPKKYLHSLVSGQLDMDRLDYLKRDSFFTGVSEGVISTERIIKMLEIHDDELVVEAKGIYSIEKFLIARRLMYWQVYLHKTVVSAEMLLVSILKRAKEIAENDKPFFASPALSSFLHHNYTIKDFEKNPKLLQQFAELDDYDIMAAIKVWQKHNDDILCTLCEKLILRKLNRIDITNSPAVEGKGNRCKAKAIKLFHLKDKDVTFFVQSGTLTNSAYSKNENKINLLYRDGKLVDIATASDQHNISLLSTQVKKYFLYYPKECEDK
ncbi:MAG: HD domain-containing protein [Bacteroidota bacterium]